LGQPAYLMLNLGENLYIMLEILMKFSDGDELRCAIRLQSINATRICHWKGSRGAELNCRREHLIFMRLGVENVILAKYSAEQTMGELPSVLVHEANVQ
jgi:hypothetical protein